MWDPGMKREEEKKKKKKELSEGRRTEGSRS